MWVGLCIWWGMGLMQGRPRPQAYCTSTYDDNTVRIPFKTHVLVPSTFAIWPMFVSHWCFLLMWVAWRLKGGHLGAVWSDFTWFERHYVFMWFRGSFVRFPGGTVTRISESNRRRLAMDPGIKVQVGFLIDTAVSLESSWWRDKSIQETRVVREETLNISIYARLSSLYTVFVL